MSAVMSRPAADFYTSTETRSVDELDAAIGRLVSPDERRFVSHARARARVRRSVRVEEVVVQELRRVALVALRYLARRRHGRRCARRTRCVRCPRSRRRSSEGRLSYSKVRALTRVAQMHDEDLLLAYALNATVQRVEERCRQIRNVAPDSVHHARRAWENRSLTMWRDEGRGLMRFTVEVPIDEGELIVAGARLRGGRGRGHDGCRSRRRRRVEGHGLARAAGRCARRGGEVVSRRRAGARGRRDGGSLSGRRARRREIPHGRDRAARICRSIP